MKIPKYIDKLLDRRARLASLLNSVDYEVTKWIDKNGIEVESYDYATGVEMYANPYASAERIKEAIRKKNSTKIHIIVGTDENPIIRLQKVIATNVTICGAKMDLTGSEQK